MIRLSRFAMCTVYTAIECILEWSFRVETDLFYSDSNLAALRESIGTLQRGEGTVRTLEEFEEMGKQGVRRVGGLGWGDVGACCGGRPGGGVRRPPSGGPVGRGRR